MAGPSPSHTDLVYGLLRAGRYDAAASALTSQLSATPRSRAALSLLAYCRYALHEYAAAAALYAQLAAHPDVSPSVSCDGARYALHRAACLFHAGEYSEAAAACDAASAAVEAVGAAASAAEASAAERGESPQGRFEGERPHERAGSSRGRQEEERQERQSYGQYEEELRDVAEQLRLLRAGIAYDQEDAATARGLLPSLEAGWGRRHDEDDARETGLGGGGSAHEEGVDSVELLTAHGCIAYKEMRMDAARDLFNAAVAGAWGGGRVRGDGGGGQGHVAPPCHAPPHTFSLPHMQPAARMPTPRSCSTASHYAPTPSAPAASPCACWGASCRAARASTLICGCLLAQSPRRRGALTRLRARPQRRCSPHSRPPPWWRR